MRQIFLIAITIITFFACSKKETDRMELTGSVKGLKKGTLLLQTFKDTILTTVDSVVVDGNSAFTFSENIESPQIYYLYVRPKDGSLRDDRITFFAENGDITIQTNLKNFGSAAVVSGSKNDSVFREYLKLKNRFINRNLSLLEAKLQLGESTEDSTFLKIEQQQRALISNKYLATINFAINNNNLEVAPYLMLSEVFDANVKYLDTVYNALQPKIKDSKYGKELESFIKNRKKADTLL